MTRQTRPMTITHRKYNPGFLSGPELTKIFCVRTTEFASLVEALRDNADASNQHTIVIGPRGSGKTTLLRRVAAEIVSDGDLSSRFFPVVFAEESYEVSTCGEFWLEALSRLALQVPDSDGNVSLRLTLDELRRERDDRRLGERCLGALLDFAKEERKKLVLIVENLDMMFAEMTDPDAGWRLRKTLQTEPRVWLLGSTVSRFDEIDRPDRALYDFFRDLTLASLDQKESAALWESVSGRAPDAGMIRSLQILTGGNPRLLTIVAGLGGDLSVRNLATRFLDLVDEHTGYFKNHLEALPHQERRVYLALATLWRPSTAREVADQARLNVNTCSAQIRRLVTRGVVANAGGTKRRKLYRLAERMYSIYCLLRTKNDPDKLVARLVEFMTAFYVDSVMETIVQYDAVQDRTESRELSARNCAMLCMALLGKAAALGGTKREKEQAEAYAEATRTATATIERAAADDAALLQHAHAMLAFARLAAGDVDSGERELAAALKMLAGVDKLEGGAVDRLINISLFLEPLRMAALIRESRADRLLLPLVVALELEGGETPRVAREVEEVASDVRRKLAERRRIPKRLRRL